MSKLIVNCETGEEVTRDFNKAEIDQQKIDEANHQKNLLAEQAEAEAKEASRKAILERLGISVEELKTILG